MYLLYIIFIYTGTQEEGSSQEEGRHQEEASNKEEGCTQEEDYQEEDHQEEIKCFRRSVLGFCGFVVFSRISSVVYLLFMIHPNL